MILYDFILEIYENSILLFLCKRVLLKFILIVIKIGIYII